MPRLRLVMVLLALATASISAQQLLPVPRATTELLTNGGFEADFDGWTGKGIDLVKSDKVKCDKPEKLVAHSGICAFMFRGNADGSSSKIQQTLADTSALVNGATVTFSVYMDALSGAVGETIGKAKVIYSDDTKTKFSLSIPTLRSRGVEDYQQISDTQSISLGEGVTITKAKVDFRYKAPGGKFLIDDASFAIVTDDPTPTASETASATDLATETPTPADTLTPTPTLVTPTSTIEETSTATPTPEDTPTPTATNTPPVPIQLLADDGAILSQFGFAVAISGDTAAVGAIGDNNNQGAVYIFTHSGGVWTQQQKLTASDGEAQDQFGFAVAMDGNTMVIDSGELDDEDLAQVYVFVYDGVSWNEQQILSATEPYNGFGQSVAIDGDTIVVGESRDDELGMNAGAAYVYTRSGNIWTQQQKLTASDAEAQDQFGMSVTVEGDTVIVGAWVNYDSSIPATKPGAAYVFTRSGGVWTEQQKLTASDGENDDHFGFPVVLDGNTLAIGAVFDDNLGIETGSAYIFMRSGGFWTEQQKLTASDGDAGDFFGLSIDIEGDTAVVGAFHYDDLITGGVYVFTHSGGTWTEQYKLTLAGSVQGENIGPSVSLDGSTLLAGAPLHAIGENFSQGSAWIFELP